jgi:hypothetical protein
LNVATLPGATAPAGTVHAYEYVAGVPGVAVIAASNPVHTVGLFTVTVGSAFNDTVPEAETLTQPVTKSVRITE